MIKYRFLAASIAFIVALTYVLVVAQEKTAAATVRTHFRAKQLIGSKVSIERSTSVGTIDDLALLINTLLSIIRPGQLPPMANRFISITDSLPPRSDA